MLYTLGEIAAVCGGELTGADVFVREAFTDSRTSTIGSGALFVAIAGRNHDGHDYIGELHARGVRAFIVEREVDAARWPDAGFVKVASGVDALQKLAADWRARFRGTVVGITGSNGKTVVKEWVAALAPAGVKLFRSPRSYNSQIGVPLSVLMIEGDEAVAVIEAGISRRGEMERLARVVRPDVGIFTTLGDAHQENFDSPEHKAAEKALLFEGAHTVIYNGAYCAVADALANSGARLVDTATTTTGDGMVRCGADGPQHDASAARENAATAAALWNVLGYSDLDFGKLHSVAMRLELREGINGAIVVDDSYNSDINSLAIALDYLQSVAGGRGQTLVLGDILQSGMVEDELYARVGAMVARSGVERMAGVGERIGRHRGAFTAHNDTLRVDFHPTVESFLAELKRDDVAGRAILVKGNRGSRFERIVHALGSRSHTTVMEVDLDAMTHNLNALRVPGVRTMAMVKAGSYGHGGYEVAAALQHQGVDYLAVAFADEGVALRQRGIAMPIVVLNADADSFELMIANALEPEIYNFESLEAFAEALGRHGERTYPVHIKLDTGMHRLGFGEGDIVRLCGELARHAATVRVGSIFSHLSCADDATADDFTRGQIALFDRMSGGICNSLNYRPLRHLANSAGAVRFPEARFDMVRLGLGLYGFGSEGLRPVASLQTRIVQVRELATGEAVGYGREGVLTRQSSVAVIPIGYADGLNRRLGCGRWSMLVNGHASPTVGRVSMDTCVVDVTGSGARVGDRVEIFGATAGHTVEDMARALDTIPYEVMTAVSARVKRLYTKE